jgi:hypothetical protein
MAINYLTIIVSIIMLITMAGTRSIVTQSEKIKLLIPGVLEHSNIYPGIWVTADGYIRHELNTEGRYDEAHGSRQSAYSGKYEIRGNHIRYSDDTGFIATGDFSGKDILYYGGHVFYRQPS